MIDFSAVNESIRPMETLTSCEVFYLNAKKKRYLVYTELKRISVRGMEFIVVVVTILIKMSTRIIVSVD